MVLLSVTTTSDQYEQLARLSRPSAPRYRAEQDPTAGWVVVVVTLDMEACERVLNPHFPA